MPTKLQSRCLSKLVGSHQPSAVSHGSSPHRPITSSPHHGIIPFVFIIILATVLRLYQLDLIDVRFDEASALQSALAITHGQFVAFAPHSGSVANHPPVYLYVLALPYLLTRNMLVIAGYRVLLDVCAIGLTHALCVRYFNRRAAFFTALFYTLSPWAIQLARRTWLAPLSLWGVLLLWGLLEVVQRHNPHGWALTGIAFALAIGTHLSAIYVLPVVLAVAVWQWRTLRLRPLLLGLLPMALLMAIYLAYDAQHDFANVRAVLGGAAQSLPREWSLNSLRFAFWLSGGNHLSDLTGPAFAAWQVQWPDWLGWIDILQMAVLGAFFMLFVVRQFTPTPTLPHASEGIGEGTDSPSPAIPIAGEGWGGGRFTSPVILLALWFVVPVLLQLRPSQPLQLHYLLPLYPAQFVMMGWAVARLTTDGRPPTTDLRLWRSVVGGLLVLTLVLILVWQLAITIRFTDFIAQHNTAAGGYGEPARTGLAAAQAARAGIQAGMYRDVIVVAPGGDPQVNEAATIMDVFLADVPHRFVNAEAGLILRGEPTQYLFTPGSAAALSRLTQLLPAGDVLTQTFKFRADDPRTYVYAQVRPVALDVQRVAAGVGHWAYGVDLIGYRTQRIDDTLLFETFASVTQAPPAGADVHWFTHVLNAGRQKLAQLDGGGVPPNNWRVGDVLWHWYDLPLARDATIAKIRIGSYRYPSLEPVSVLDAAGNPIADSVELTLP